MESNTASSDHLFLFLLLLFLSACFSASETAFFSLSRIKLKLLEEEKKQGKSLILELLSKPRRLLIIILTGNTFVNIAIAAFSSGLALKISHRYQLSEAICLSAGALIATLMTVLFGEVAPKNYAYNHNEKLSRFFSWPLYFLRIILSPLLLCMIWLVNLVLKLSGFDREKMDEPFITHEEIENIFLDGEDQKILKAEEQDMIEEVFEFEERSVKEIMTPRHEITGIPRNASFEDIMNIYRQQAYSRMPVYKGQIDNVIGVLYIKDFLSFALKKNRIEENFRIDSYLHKAYFVPETKKVSDLFRELKQRKMHMAIVVDEYGGTEGLVTMENILEEVVGDIFDEYDVESEEIEIVRDGEDTWVVAGTANLSDLEDTLGIEDLFSEETDVVTVGGLIYGNLGEIPEQGASVTYKNIIFTVEEMAGNRIESVRVRKC